ncbi:uncharacterized protein ATC70_004436 [Mucor velutinosus]|uniref:Uncharacterized protein n=1 Tax=Mucor velutinosus TaxID=708070 RepID=A0AAN7DRA0_9FUNG|nr:hypothetical protein ATC70_004436 [Mucor velutinosus]
MYQAQQLFLQRLENTEQELSNLSKQVKECNDNQTEVKAMLQHIVQQSTSSSTANVARLHGVICRPSKADNKHLEELSVELCISVLEEHRLGGGKNLDGKKVWELVKDAAYNQAKKADRQFPNITFSKLDNRLQALLVKTVINDVAKKGVDISGFFKDWLPQFAVSKPLSGIIDYKYNARPSNDTATHETQFDDDLVFSEGSQAQSEEDSVDDDENSIVDKINFHVSRNTGSQK